MKNKQMYAMEGGQTLLNKGFTLIELLAVIVILAIIALIATPTILGIINDVRVGARERSIDNIIHAAEIYYAQEKMKDVNTSNKINIEDIKDKIDGEIPEGGYIIINEAGDAIFELEFKDKTYVKLFTGEIVEEPKNADKYYIKLATTTNGETEPFLEGPIRKEQIEKITTVPTNKVPSDVIGYWDVTDTTNQSETGKVMVWYYDKDSNGLYEIYIGQEGRVKANPDSTKLFNYIINLKEIDLTYFDTSNVTNMWCLFQCCEDLEKIIGLENFDTSSVENMRNIFNKCYKLQFLNLSSFDRSNVTTMHGMFQYCKSLTELDVSNFDTSNAENMGLMFSNCHKLQSLNLSSFNTAKVTDMNSMFQNCLSLKEIDVSSFDTSNVVDMRLMFAGADIDEVPQYMKLERIIGLENFDTSQVTTMQAMFQCCSSLTSLDVSKFDTGKVTTMKWMFNGCSNLTSLDISNFDTNKVTDMSKMFNSTPNLKPIYIGEKWKTASTTTYMFGGTALTKSVDEMCGPNSTQEWCVSSN